MDREEPSRKPKGNFKNMKTRTVQGQTPQLKLTEDFDVPD